MWRQFSDEALGVVVVAKEEAAKLGDNHLTPEHLLLGLIKEDTNTAVVLLEQMGLSRRVIRDELKAHLAKGPGRNDSELELTPGAKRVIDYAHEALKETGCKQIRCEHLLLGLTRHSETKAAEVLWRLGATYDKIRDAVKALQS